MEFLLRRVENKNILIKPNSAEEHSMYFEVEGEISCKAYEEKEINIIDDLLN